MKAIVVAAASALAFAPALTSGATAAPAQGSAWTFTDYTPDPVSLAADNSLHVVSGTTITSYCHGSRVPSAPQDVNAHRVNVSARGVLRLAMNASGAWGLDVSNRRGTPLAGVTTSGTGATALTVHVRPGQYVVQACNLGGSPTAQVAYRLVR